MTDATRAEAETDRWSFKEGTLREKLVWCRWQHQIEAELNAKGTVYAQRTAEASEAWHLACVDWYDGMIRDLAAVEAIDEDLRAAAQAVVLAARKMTPEIVALNGALAHRSRTAVGRDVR